MTTSVSLLALLLWTAHVGPPGTQQRPESDLDVRHRAVIDGLRFIRGLAASPPAFEELASDFIWCFATVATTSSDREVRNQASLWGRQLGRLWIRTHASIPPRSGPDEVVDYAMSVVGLERLGLSHPRLRDALEARLRSYGPNQLLGFDPRDGPPPLRVLRLEGKEACEARGERGSTCPPLVRRVPDHDLWYDALITVWFGEAFGMPFGVTLEQLMRHRPQLMPYLGLRVLGEDAWFDEVYLVTHIVYAHNGYGAQRSNPILLAEEMRYLIENIEPLVATEDGETYAELVDTLLSFGTTVEEIPALGKIRARLLAAQNGDGSWGAPDESDVYTRFHATWTAIDALRAYRWQ